MWIYLYLRGLLTAAAGGNTLMHTTRHRYLILLFCLAFMVPLVSMVGALGTAQAATATIHGTVRLNDGGDGGPGTRLANIPVLIWRRDGQLTVQKKTGSDGYFSSGSVNDAGAGFNIAFNKPGEPGYDSRYTTAEVNDVYLGDAVNGYKVVNKNLDLVSQPSGKVTLSGRVTSTAGGAGIAGIQVYFWRHDGDAFTKTTDANGYFSAEVNRYSDWNHYYNIVANKNLVNTAWNEVTRNDVVPDQNRNDISFALTPSGSSDPNPTPAPSPGATSDLFGLAINANYPQTNPPDSDLSDLGVKWVRTIKYEHQEITQHGNVNWLVIFNHESLPSQRSDESWDAYSNRFAEAAKAFAAGHTWVRAVQIWNEPDLNVQGAGPHLTEQQYAVLLRATYLKVKELPNPPIVVSAGLATGADGAAAYVKNVRSYWGGQIYYDAVGFHPYVANCNGLTSGQTITQAINTVYAQTGGKQLWLTEFGAPVQWFGNNENTHAAYLDCLYRTIPTVKDGSNPKVGVAFWFAWDDRTHYNPDTEWFGLVRQNWQSNLNNPSAYRRPAWYKYQALAKASSTSNTVAFSDGMESGTGAWTVYQATIAGSTTQRHVGSASMQFSGTGPVYQVKNGKTVSGGTHMINYVAVSPNTKYEISAWVYNPASTNVEANLYVQQYRGTAYSTKIKGSNAFTYDQYMAKTVNSGNGWQKLSVTFTTHSEARYLDSSLCTRETGKTIYWDDVQIRKV
jgi:hypothetical protein